MHVTTIVSEADHNLNVAKACLALAIALLIWFALSIDRVGFR